MKWYIPYNNSNTWYWFESKPVTKGEYKGWLDIFNGYKRDINFVEGRCYRSLPDFVEPDQVKPVPEFMTEEEVVNYNRYIKVLTRRSIHYFDPKQYHESSLGSQMPSFIKNIHGETLVLDFWDIMIPATDKEIKYISTVLIS